MGRCWFNPEAKGCKTCKHFDPGDNFDHATGYPGYDEGCALGVNLEGRPACERCGGGGVVFVGPDDPFGGTATECPECGGEGEAIKAGPIVGCEKWEAGEDR